MNRKLSLKKAILYSVHELFKNPWFFVKFMLLWGGLALLRFLLTGFVLFPFKAFFSLPITLSLIAIFFIFIEFYFEAVLSKILLNYRDRGPQPFSFHLLFTQISFAMLIKLIVASLIYLLILGIGFLLLILPGIYFLVKFDYFWLTIIDTNCGIIEAFKRSYQITNNNFWRLLVLIIITSLLTHLIITIPLALLMLIHAYRQLYPVR